MTSGLRQRSGWSIFAGLVFAFVTLIDARASNQPYITGNVNTNGQREVSWTPTPSIDVYRLLTTVDLKVPFQVESNGQYGSFSWTGPLLEGPAFHRLEVVPMNSNAVLTATVLSRLSFGQTPDELERILTGPAA